MLIMSVIFYILAFFMLGLGADFIVKGIDHLSKRINLSAFSLSFFVLGLLTSVPEFSLGINAVISGEPEIFVGNLIGGSITIMLFVISVLAILGKGIKLYHKLDEKNLILALLTIIAPVFFIADNLVTRTEAVFLMILYLILVYFVEKKKGLLERITDQLSTEKRSYAYNLGRILIGIIMIFLASRFIVDRTVYFSQLLNLPLFLVSLLILPLGTNLPEFSIAVRSILSKKKEIAFGDYLGSAAANTLLFGFLTLVYGQRINVSRYSMITLILFLFSFFLFYSFSRSKDEISREEGIILFLTYLLFVLVEMFV